MSVSEDPTEGGWEKEWACLIDSQKFIKIMCVQRDTNGFNFRLYHLGYLFEAKKGFKRSLCISFEGSSGEFAGDPFIWTISHWSSWRATTEELQRKPYVTLSIEDSFISKTNENKTLIYKYLNFNKCRSLIRFKRKLFKLDSPLARQAAVELKLLNG